MTIADIIPTSTGGWSAVIGIVGALIAWLSSRHRNRADVTAVLSQTSLEWIHELREEIDRLEEALDNARADADRHRDDATFLRYRGIALETRLREAGIDPADTGGPYGGPLSPP